MDSMWVHLLTLPSATYQDQRARNVSRADGTVLATTLIRDSTLTKMSLLTAAMGRLQVRVTYQTHHVRECR